MKYQCDMCGTKVELDKTEKLLNKRYCRNCIMKAKEARRKAIRLSNPRTSRSEVQILNQKSNQFLKRLNDNKINSLDSIVSELKVTGLDIINSTKIPIRLKRNEKVYLLAGRTINRVMSIALTITNQRLFFVNTEYPLRIYLEPKENMNIIRGIKVITLSSIIAIATPKHGSDYKQWESIIHLDKGKGLSIKFSTCQGARLFYAILAEMVDRINDPIDNTVFSPNRERIPEEVKIAVWRRDGGVCAHCGSREKLEYDHIIPVSKGGSNSQRNIELLCEKCNRKKSNKIIL